MKRLLSIIILVVCWSSAQAQFFRRIDDWLKANQEKQPYDTTYIFRPQERWLIRSRSQVNDESVLLSAQEGNDIYAFGLRSGTRFKQSFGVGYRNVSLDFGFVPFAKQKVLAFDMQVYGNRLSFTGGLSVFTGEDSPASVNEQKIIIPANTMSGLRGQLNLMYAFNGKRFSMPAARIQTYRQVRSAGSALAIVSAQFYGAFAMDDLPSDMPIRNGLTGLLGLGAGYGYNWVPSEHWLIHLCLTETVGLLNNTLLTINDRTLDFGFRSPVFVTDGSISVCYYLKKFYFGVSANTDFLVQFVSGDSTSINGAGASEARLTAGIRF